MKIGQFIPTKLSSCCYFPIIIYFFHKARPFNPRTYTQIHSPTVVQGVGEGWMEPLPGVFDMLQYFVTILPLMESLNLLNKMRSWIVERPDGKLMSLGLISYGRLVGSCSRMALDGSIIVEICDETTAKMWCKPVEL